jgi:hypothetical protein
MTFRSVVRDGIIVINTHGELPDGTPVEVVPSKGRNARAARTTTAKTRRKGKKGGRHAEADPLPGFGILKDRADWKGKSAVQIIRELRRKALRRS